MDALELRARIARGEDLHTDLKQLVGTPDELAKDIVCFANTDGGQIIIGVSDDRKIVGVDDPDPLHRQVDNAAFNNCEPPITVVPETVNVDEKTAVVINVPKGSQRPHRTNKGRYYVRSTSGCRDASREELRRLLQELERRHYDETPLPRLDAGDLDLQAVDRFLESTSQTELRDDPQRLLRAWGLLSGGHPTVGGLLLFGRDPQKHLPYAQINAARFPGSDVAAAPSDRKDIRGRLFDVIEDARRFLGLHLKLPHEIKGFEPEPKPELPEAVLREAIVNAVAHRDYTIQGPIRLFIFDDRIEIHTPGRPPNSVDAEAMRAGVHVFRNPRIYGRLSDACLVTRAGTGVPRIVKLVRDATSKDVGLEVRDFEVLLSIPRKMDG